MTATTLRVVVADDERPARRFLTGLLKTIAGVQLVGEAGSGQEAVAMIEAEKPHVALLDLQMPEMGGLDVARKLLHSALPLIAFVTAFDAYAVEAFELNAIDYLLKPVQKARLVETLERARQRLKQPEPVDERAASIVAASRAIQHSGRRQYVERIPVRRRDEVVILQVRQIASAIAEGELLHLTTISNERYTISHRLHALEAKLDPRRFVRLGRGTLANLDVIVRVNPMPGGTYVVKLSNGQELQVSRIQSRILRETLLKL